MADGTLFGLIHDIQDRRRARKVRDARRNFLNDPVGTIQEVHNIDPDIGLQLGDYYRQRTQEEEAARTAREQAERERALTAARGLTQGLKRVKDSGGDVVSAFEESVPVLRSGFNLRDDEIDQWRQRIAGDPNTIDQMYQLLNEPSSKESKLYDLSPGSALFDHTGRQIAAVPALPKTVSIRRPDGGTDLFVMDEAGNFIQSNNVPASRAGGGPLQINPQSRGMRNMNPGNIKDGPWARRQPGYVGSDGTFARFESLEAGQQAQMNLLRDHYVNGQRSTQDIIMKYLGGPNNPENSPESQRNYVEYVANRLGLDPNAPVPPEMLPQLAQAITEFENGVPSSGGVRPAYSTPAATPEPDGWRVMTAEEKASLGLDPNAVYQVGIGGDNDGAIRLVPGQGKSVKQGQSNGTAQANDAVRAAKSMRDAARRIRNHPAYQQATGSIQGRLPSVMQSTRDFDDQLEAFRDRVVIDTITAMKKASETGATGFGQLTEREGERLENSMGSLRQTSPETLRRTLQELERDAMISIGTLYNIPPEATMMLLQNPNLADKFDEKYGKGRAAEILGE